MGATSFNAQLAKSATGIIKRICMSCLPSHQEIYYRRITPVGSLDLYNVLKSSWFSANNTLGVHFGLYSTYADAVRRTNSWTFCNYDDPGVGAFRHCGPSEIVYSQWNTFSGNFEWLGAQPDVAFYIDAGR